MTHDQFPMFKLVTLIARQMSAPIARRIKLYAKDHPTFGRQICGRLARIYGQCELRYKVWSLQIRKPKGTQPQVSLSNQQGIELGADILGEIIIFILGACIVMFELNRQAANQEAKVLDKKSQRLAMKLSLEELQRELQFQQIDINRLMTELRAKHRAIEEDKEKEKNPPDPPGDTNR